MYVGNERESANNLACTAEIHRWNSPADKNYDTRFRLNAQCANAAKGMDFSKRLFFFVGYNPACFYEMPLMHFESIAQSLKEAAVARVSRYNSCECRNIFWETD